MDNEYDITNTISMILTQYIDNEYDTTNTINMIVRATHLYATPEHLYATPEHLYATPEHLYATPEHLYATPRTPVCNTSIQQYVCVTCNGRVTNEQ